MSSHARAMALSTLSGFEAADATVGDRLACLAEITLHALPAANVAGMMFGNDGEPTTVFFSDPESPEIEAVQCREDEGPCLDAWREARVIRIGQISQVAREYPAFAAACAERGISSWLSLPMTSGETAVGSLNLYAYQANGFTEDDESVGLDLARAAGSVLANVSADRAVFDPGQQLNGTMEQRAVIDEAKGILMADDQMAASIELPADTSSALRARRFVAGFLAQWECDHVVDDAVLVISELVTNAVVHARSSSALRLHLHPGILRIEVTDVGSGTPDPRSPVLDEPGGRGLLIVAALAHAWGSGSTPEGKVVWVEMAT